MTMSDRERLIELISSKCQGEKRLIDGIADHLLANGVILPPCKVGDVVYYLSYNTEACQECEYLSVGWFAGDSFCTEDYSLYPDFSYEPDSICSKHFIEIIEIIPNEDWIVLNRQEFGKTVFLTREEAEKKLKG